MKTTSPIVVMEGGCLILETKETSATVISVPHDGLLGRDFKGLFKPREVGYRGRDRHIWPVVRDVILFYPVSVVRGMMPRTYVDYNRAWPEGINYYPLLQQEVHTALDDENLLPAYLFYHSSIDRLLQNSIEKFGKEKVLLLDFHGFSKQPAYAPPDGYDLILGTGNRVTIPHGDADRQLAAFLQDRGYHVFLPQPLAVGPEEDYYSADYTTRHHSEKYGINTIQVEVASCFRTRGAKDRGQKLSIDFAEFLKNYCCS